MAQLRNTNVASQANKPIATMQSGTIICHVPLYPWYVLKTQAALRLLEAALSLAGFIRVISEISAVARSAYLLQLVFGIQLDEQQQPTLSVSEPLRETLRCVIIINACSVQRLTSIVQ